MVLVVLFGLACAIWFLSDMLSSSRPSDDPFHTVFGLLFSVGLGLFLGGLAGAAAAGALGEAFGPKSLVSEPQAQIVSLRRGDSGSQAEPGPFLIGSYTSGCQVIFQFQVKNPDGSITPKQIVADGTVHIIQDRSLKDVGFWTTTRKWVDYKKAYELWILGGSGKVTREEFRVPVGSVVRFTKDKTVCADDGPDVIPDFH